MSLGGSLPYHLRQNKAIERNLFVDLLSRIGRYCNISDYRYVGFGGPFLEDYKLLHSRLRISDMISLEKDENVVARQEFNRPMSNIQILPEDSGDFLDSYSFSESTIVWFDYAEPKIALQLPEVQRLVSLLHDGDIFKVTLNAEASSLGCNNGELIELQKRRLEKIKGQLSEYLPEDLNEEAVTRKNYPGTLLKALKNAVGKALRSERQLTVLPLTAFLYKDGQMMLTATGIILDQKKVSDFKEKTRLECWDYCNFSWDDPLEVSVPDLSIKERIHIESMLPGMSEEEILDNLNYYVGASEDEGLKLLRNFINYYRQHPWYSKISI